MLTRLEEERKKLENKQIRHIQGASLKVLLIHPVESLLKDILGSRFRAREKQKKCCKNISWDRENLEGKRKCVNAVVAK